MALRYALVRNAMKPGKEEYLARPVNNPIAHSDDIIDLMVNRGSTVTRAEALSVIEEYHRAITELLSQGHSIRTELFGIDCAVRGTFDAHDALFTKRLHRVRPVLRAGKRLVTALEGIPTVRVEKASVRPLAKMLYDYTSGLTDGTLSRGGLVSIRGRHLKISTQVAGAGLFFKMRNGDRLQLPAFVKNTPTEWMFLVPKEWPAWACEIEVCTVLKKCRQLSSTQLLLSVSLV
ncbi:uncharacterized protein with Ig-like fold DUF4469 [Breznakibacter xylanolyticus]|uniref:Uncharacterized protein with Ig-like fold DUF4469 n=1 Tax=Breznakibacter xylanolyticus TaxID=990 RepID=A0A2W7NE00_9BACT|nr:DNA-binding domain-containing protein [Breznakibacter xylanolyticus]PZX14974.1 uncharacterized protein with Ig-like fold DUF4469 [Breznakibacter xylanolyticus]